MKRFVIAISLIVLGVGVLSGAAPSKMRSMESVTPTANTPAAVIPQEATSDSHQTVEVDSTVDQNEPSVRSTSAEAAATYEIDWYSVNGGGTVNATSTNYRMGASIGQSVAGAASSASYNMGIGFWYGAGSSGGCACDCHNDPVCDAVISNVQDVVATIGVAFRGAAAIGDPNGACPFETTDMNCDGFTSVIDVVKVVNVAFRGANPATEYCVACP